MTMRQPEKALEVMFAQLEKVLNSKDDDVNVSTDDVQFTNEELAQMMKELEAAFSEMNLEGEEDEEVEEEETGLMDMVCTPTLLTLLKATSKNSQAGI